MFLNKKRVSAYEWDGEQESTCPQCGGELVAKRGEIMTWHWAHKSNSCRYGSGISEWHLCWTHGHHQAGFPVEYRHTMKDGTAYVFDACHPEAMLVYEFVHSLSDSYLYKHEDMLKAGIHPVWILDGDMFKAKYARKLRGNPIYGWSGFLKPKAKQFLEEIDGELFALIHFQGSLYTPYPKDNVIELVNQNQKCIHVFDNNSESDDPVFCETAWDVLYRHLKPEFWNRKSA